MKASAKYIAFALLVAILMLFAGCADNHTLGITNAEINNSGELVLTYSDGSEQNLGTVVGKDGIDGINGTNGQDGTITITDGGSNIALATSKGLQSAVSIICKFEKTVKYGYGYGWGNSGGNSTSEYESRGSGVIYQLDKSEGDAFIITNYHVVYDVSSNADNGISKDISVYIYGSENSDQGIKAEYVGGSLYYDIAVLRIEDSNALKNSCAVAATLADSDKTTVGEPAIAVGNPEGMGTSASYGIVSVDSEHISMTAADGKTTVSFRVFISKKKRSKRLISKCPENRDCCDENQR